MNDPPVLLAGHTVLDGPMRYRNELRWELELDDGRKALLDQLLPELSQEQALRRRYVRDLRMQRELEVPGLAPILDLGPSDPFAPGAIPPWRLRLRPEGETLAHWLNRRAPASLEEVCRMVAELASVLQQLHRKGWICRDLHPDRVVLQSPRGLCLVDLGLSRVELLSSLTASSLMLDLSPYAPPRTPAPHADRSAFRSLQSWSDALAGADRHLAVR